MRRLFVLVWVLFLIVTAALIAKPNRSGPKLELIHAETFTSRAIDGRIIRILKGDVLFRQGETRMRCEHARHQVDAKRVVFMGQVEIHDPQKALYADRIEYDMATDIQVAQGHVRFVDSTLKMLAPKIVYDRNRERVEALEQFMIIDSSRNMTLSGEHGFYLRDKDYVKVVEKPVFTQKDSLPSQTLTITGNHMERFGEGDSIRVSGEVTLKRDRWEATGTKLLYVQEHERIDLTGSPVAAQAGDYIIGEQIRMNLDGTKIASIIVEGQACVSTTMDTAAEHSSIRNYLSGTMLTISLTDSHVDSVEISGQATSYYHVFEKGRNQGLNAVQGDRLWLYFEDKQLVQVNVTSTPGESIGQFLPVEIKIPDKVESAIESLRDRFSQRGVVMDSGSPRDSVSTLVGQSG